MNLHYTFVGLFLLLQNQLCVDNGVAIDVHISNATTEEEILINLNKIGQKINTIKDNLIVVIKEAKDLLEVLDTVQVPSKKGQFLPPSKDSNKVKQVYNKIKEIQNNINKLNSDLNGNVGDVNSVKERISVLEQDLENLYKQIDNEKRETQQVFGEYDGTLREISNSYKELVDKLAKRLNDMEKKETDKSVLECIAAILNKDYYSAVSKIGIVPDDKVPFIVNQVSNKINNTFDSLFLLSDQINNLNQKFLIYKALSEEFVNRNINDDCQVVKLINLVKTQLINSDNCSSDIKLKAVNVYKVLINQYKNIISIIIKENFSTGSQPINIDVSEFPKITIKSGYTYVIIGYNLQLISNKSYTCEQDHTVLGI